MRSKAAGGPGREVRLPAGRDLRHRGARSGRRGRRVSAVREPAQQSHSRRHHCAGAIPAPVAARAREIARAILEAMEYVGVLCVEFFVTTDGELLVNELAPRPHNSGHLTFDAAVTSQFEQQVRAICGLPLGSTELLQAGGDGEPARRSLGRRRAELGGGLPVSRREAAPVRQDAAAPGQEDGTPHGHGAHRRRKRRTSSSPRGMRCFRKSILDLLIWIIDFLSVGGFEIVDCRLDRQ